MPHLLSETDIVQLIDNGTIKNGKRSNAEGVKYDFTLSTRVLKAEFKTPIDISKLNETERARVFVNPGEVVFVLTDEHLELPSDIYVVLIPKRKMSHEGVMILGGLSVDPCYKGRLLIGIYNFSSSPFPLPPGKKLIGSQFFRLLNDEVQPIQKPETSINDFPDDLFRLMEKYTPISTQSLSDKLNSIEHKFEEFKKEFRDRENWFDKFQRRIEEQEKNIEKLLQGLHEEADNRRRNDNSMEDEIKSFRNDLKDLSKSSYKTAAVIAIIGAFAISLFIWFLQEIVFKHKNSNDSIPYNNQRIDSSRR